MKLNVSYVNVNKQADKSLVELINLGRRYVAGAEALWPKYREACNRNQGLRMQKTAHPLKTRGMSGFFCPFCKAFSL